MRKVVFALVAAASATACTTDDGTNPPGEDGIITAKWSFKELATGDSLVCPTGFNTTAVHVIPVDDVGTRLGAGVIDLYNCDAFTGTEFYPPDLYEVYMEITTDNNSAKYADTPSTFVDIITTDRTIMQTIIDDGGFFVFDWQLRDAVGGAPLTCAQAAADSVDITATLVGTSSAKSDVYKCKTDGFRDSGTGTSFTAGLIAGDYTVSISALNTADQAVGVAPALTNKRISAPNKITDLGTIMIPID